MRGLLAFLYRYRVFLFFLFLEFVCAWLLISYNNYYNASFLNSSNRLAGSIQALTTNTIEYGALRKVNDELAMENRQLRQRLLEKMGRSQSTGDTTGLELILAKVVNNNFRRSANYLTINRGAAHGIQPGMGVLSDRGAIGIVKSVSDNYATVTSLLHQKLMVSSQLKSTGTLGTTQWNALSPLQSKLKFLPKHIPVAEGDTIVTSGFNAVFPEGILLGTVASFSKSEESAFYDVTINLANDFTSLGYVNVILNRMKSEKDSLELYNE